jgi:hypothetical protein
LWLAVAVAVEQAVVAVLVDTKLEQHLLTQFSHTQLLWVLAVRVQIPMGRKAQAVVILFFLVLHQLVVAVVALLGLLAQVVVLAVAVAQEIAAHLYTLAAQEHQVKATMAVLVLVGFQ